MSLQSRYHFVNVTWERQASASSADGPDDSPRPQKRKRLAKACNPCHKSKRRCDGDFPCGNCQFSGKRCLYTDQAGNPIDPPPAPPVPRPFASQLVTLPPSPRAIPRDIEVSILSQLPPSVWPVAPTLALELVNTFFAHMHPACLIFHRPTFLSQLCRQKIPTFLLLAVFAVASPLSTREELRGKKPWISGVPFANAACRLIFRDDSSLAQPDSLELVQALCCLRMYLGMCRQVTTTNNFLDIALEILERLRFIHEDQVDAWVHEETRRRIFHFIHFVQYIFIAFRLGGQAPRGTQSVPYPVSEARYELCTRTLDGVISGIDVNTSEFEHLSRIASVYQSICFRLVKAKKPLQGGLPPPDDSVSFIENHFNWFQNWHEALPSSFQWSEQNLLKHVTQVYSGAGSGSWIFAFIHALVFSSKLILFKFLPSGSPRYSLRQQDMAIARDGLNMIIDRLFSAGRMSMFVGIFLHTAVEYGTADPARVEEWGKKYSEAWGIYVEEFSEPDFRHKWGVPYDPPSEGASTVPDTSLKQPKPPLPSESPKSIEVFATFRPVSAARDEPSTPSKPNLARKAPVGLPWLEENQDASGG